MGKKWIANNLTDIETIAGEILDILEHKKIAFLGDLGSGKTTFIKCICKKLGIDNVKSPTFNLLNEYENGNNTVFHFDFYRIKNILEAYDIGYEEYFFSKNYVFVEWAEKVLEIIDEEFIFIKIEILDNNSRKIELFSSQKK